MNLADRLSAELGASAVISAPERRSECAVDGLEPAVVVEPPTRELVASAVAIAEAAGAAVIPRGNGTHIQIGNAPRGYDVALTTRALNRVLKHDAADMTVRVESGITFDELAAVLRSAGQWLPIDPPLPAKVTVGGMLAADLNGGLRFSHGKARDYLLGARAVVGRGVLVRGGGEVVKNVAGYDLPKLFIGSFGTLGVIVEATFKVRPLPAADIRLAYACNSLVAAAEAAQRLLDAPLAPYSIDFCDQNAAASLGLRARAHVLIRLGGEHAEVGDQRDRLARLLPGCVEVECGAQLRDFAATIGNDPNAATCRLSVLPSDSVPLLDLIERESRSFDVTLSLVAHAAGSVVRFQIVGESSTIPFLRWLRFAVRQRDGNMLVERLRPDLKTDFDVCGGPTVPIEVLKRVKEALDPKHVFSPGRFVGRL